MNNYYYKELLLKIKKRNPEFLIANIAQYDLTKENMFDYINSLQFAKDVHKHIKLNNVKQIPDSSIFEMSILDATIDKIEFYDKKFERN